MRLGFHRIRWDRPASVHCKRYIDWLLPLGVGVGAVIVLILLAPPVYETTVLIALPYGGGAMYDDPSLAARLLASPPFVTRALPGVRVDPMVRVDHIGSSRLVRLRIHGSSPLQSRRWANMLSQKFLEEANTRVAQRRAILEKESQTSLVRIQIAGFGLGEDLDEVRRYLAASAALVNLQEARIIAVNPPHKLPWWKRLTLR